MRLAALVPIAALTAASPQTADWEKPRWGSDLASTVAAAKGDTIEIRARRINRLYDLDARARGTTEFEGMRVTRTYYFDRETKGLGMVELRVDDQYCRAFREAVERHYGKPVSGDTNFYRRILLDQTVWEDDVAQLKAEYNQNRTGQGEIFMCRVSIRPK